MTRIYPSMVAPEGHRRRQAVSQPQPQGEVWQHVKRGTRYTVIGTATLQATGPLNDYAQVVVYRGDDGKLWAREEAEFTDGRFVRVSAPGATAQDGVAPPFDHAHNAALYGALAASQTPTIPAGMVAWHGGDSAPSNWDSAEPIMLATGHLFRAISMDGDLFWRHVRFRDGSLNSACIIAYTPLAAAPKQAEQQGVKALRDAAQAMVDAYDEDPDSEAVCDARNGLVAALNAPTGAVEPTARQRALADMVALDEEIEANHPGWMTGAVEKGEAK